MKDDANTAGGPGGPGVPGLGGRNKSTQDLSVVLGAMVVVKAMALVEASRLLEIKPKTRIESPSPSWAARLRT